MGHSHVKCLVTPLRRMKVGVGAMSLIKESTVVPHPYSRLGMVNAGEQNIMTVHCTCVQRSLVSQLLILGKPLKLSEPPFLL